MEKQERLKQGSTVCIPYANLESGFTQSELEVQFSIGDRMVSVFAPPEAVDRNRNCILLTIVGDFDQSTLIDLPGEPLNSSKRIKVERGWLTGTMLQ